MKINGSIVMCRDARSDGGTSYSIRLTDTGTGIVFADIVLTAEQFAGALTARYTDCEIDVAGLENVGKQIEFKTIVIPGQPPTSDADFASWLDQMRAERHKTDADGWHCEEHGYNHHHSTKGGYRLSFLRFVPKAKGGK